MRHRHNDYSCYIYIINKSESPLQLVDAKPIFGRWAHGSPPTEILPHTDALVELTDPRGPHGSEGRCTYRLHHPQRSSAITFKLRFGDPYWAKDDNYLRAYTQYPHWLSLKVPKYQAKGHPFIAYVEVNTLEVSEADRHRLRRGLSESSNMSFRSEGDTESIAETLSESLPDYEVRSPITPNFGKQPIHIIEPVDEEDGNERDYFNADKQDRQLDDLNRQEVDNNTTERQENDGVGVENNVDAPAQDKQKQAGQPLEQANEEVEVEDGAEVWPEPVQAPKQVVDPSMDGPGPAIEAAEPKIEMTAPQPPATEHREEKQKDITAEKEDDGDDLENDYLRATEDKYEAVTQPQSSRSPPSSSEKPVTIQPSKALAWLTTYLNLNIFRGWSDRGKIGIIATVFLATYGFTLSRISGGLLHRGRRW